MHRSFALGLVVSACGGAHPAPVPAPTAPTAMVSSSPAPSATPTARPPSKTLAQTCKALARANRPGVVPMPEQDAGDTPSAPLADKDLDWKPFGKCHHGPTGDAWALNLKSGATTKEGETDLLFPEIEVVHVSADGQRTSTAFFMRSPMFSYFAPGMSLTVRGVDRWTPMSESEVAICFDAIAKEQRGPHFYLDHYLTGCALYGVVADGDGQRTVYPPATPLIDEFRDVDGDGKADIISSERFGYPGRPGYCSLKNHVCPDEGHGPTVLHHALEVGWSTTDSAAREYASSQCPTAPQAADFAVKAPHTPGDLLTLMHQTGCALMWGVSRENIATWLQKAQAVMCDADCEEFDGLLAWLTQDVPLDLSKPAP